MFLPLHYMGNLRLVVPNMHEYSQFWMFCQLHGILDKINKEKHDLLMQIKSVYLAFLLTLVTRACIKYSKVPKVVLAGSRWQGFRVGLRSPPSPCGNDWDASKNHPNHSHMERGGPKTHPESLSAASCQHYLLRYLGVLDACSGGQS